ncbi:MAG: amidohydrolase [Oscillospiraceae bacterium]|nr:amidohydrolase [Oscillospiraceae bacterium]
MIPGIITVDNPDKEEIYRSLAEENKKCLSSCDGPIIDFHTHTFPARIAEKALNRLSASGGIRYYSDGTNEGLQRSMRDAGVTKSVVLPVATHDRQHTSINDNAIQVNERAEETGILSFGSLHPDNTNYREILSLLDSHAIKGIKLHPVFQEVDFDDIRYKRLVGTACEYGMIVIIHAGYDVSFPGQGQATPEKILHVLEDVRPDRLVLAHMGGWDCWDGVEKLLAGRDVWFDTSYSANLVRGTDGSQKRYLGDEEFLRLIRLHGTDRILFGSDNPWCSQKEAVELIAGLNLTKEEKNAIMGGNAAALLKLCVGKGVRP